MEKKISEEGTWGIRNDNLEKLVCGGIQHGTEKRKSQNDYCNSLGLRLGGYGISDGNTKKWI